MKIFTPENSGWGSKINFVDNNNVLVGYDTHQDCCEDAGWFIAKEITPYTYHLDTTSFDIPENIGSYVFDPSYYDFVGSEDLDAGDMVLFKLVSPKAPDLYLHIYNAHNGYYSHGLTMDINGERKLDESL